MTQRKIKKAPTPEPPVPAALIAWLEQQYPDQHPGRIDQLLAREKLGELNVVRCLRAMHERQSKSVLAGPP